MIGKYQQHFQQYMVKLIVLMSYIDQDSEYIYRIYYTRDLKIKMFHKADCSMFNLNKRWEVKSLIHVVKRQQIESPRIIN